MWGRTFCLKVRPPWAFKLPREEAPCPKEPEAHPAWPQQNSLSPLRQETLGLIRISSPGLWPGPLLSTPPPHPRPPALGIGTTRPPGAPRAKWKLGQGMPKFSDKALDPGDQLIPNAKGAGVQLWPLASASSLLPISPGQGKGRGGILQLWRPRGRARPRSHTPDTHTHLLENSQAHPSPRLSGLRKGPPLTRCLALASERERARTHRPTVPALTFGATRAFRHARMPRATAPLPDRAVTTRLVRGPGSSAPKDAPRPRRLSEQGPGAPPEGFCSSWVPSSCSPAPVRAAPVPATVPLPHQRTYPAGHSRLAEGAIGVTQDVSSLPFPDRGELRPQKPAGPKRPQREPPLPPAPPPRAGTVGPEKSPLTSWKVQRKMSVQRPEQQPMVSALSPDAASPILDPEPPARRMRGASASPPCRPPIPGQPRAPWPHPEAAPTPPHRLQTTASPVPPRTPRPGQSRVRPAPQPRASTPPPPPQPPGPAPPLRVTAAPPLSPSLGGFAPVGEGRGTPFLKRRRRGSSGGLERLPAAQRPDCRIQALRACPRQV